jgi:hypothetical protein
MTFMPSLFLCVEIPTFSIVPTMLLPHDRAYVVEAGDDELRTHDQE